MTKFASGMNQLADRPTRCPGSRAGVPQLGVLRRAVEVDDEHDEDRERDHAEDGRHRAHQVVGVVEVARACRQKVRLSSKALTFESRFPHATASASALTIDAPSSQVSAVVSPAIDRYRRKSKRSARRASAPRCREPAGAKTRRFGKPVREVEGVRARHAAVGDPLRPALAVPVAILAATERIRVPVRWPRGNGASHDADANVGRPIARPSVSPTM